MSPHPPRAAREPREQRLSYLFAGRLVGRGRRAESGIVGATAKARAEAEVLGAVPECPAAHSPQIHDTRRPPHESLPCRPS